MDKDEREDRLRFLEEELKEIANERKLLVNEDQKELLYEVFKFLLNRTDDEDDEMFLVEYEEENDSVWVSARLLMCDCTGYKEVEGFCKMLNRCTEFFTEPCEDDGIYIRVLVPNVFSRKIRLAR